jgi:polysaccharide biosynthesis protein PelF
MRIALVTEGTYPHRHGGVSVWCDQLVRGLAPHSFVIYALTGTGDETVAWDLPDNVTDLVTLPLWAQNLMRRPTPAERRQWVSVWRRLVTCLVGEADQTKFAEALVDVMPLAESGALPALLSSNSTVRRLLRGMAGMSVGRPGGDQLPQPTVADALTTVRLIEHYLRPLAAPPPSVDVCHAAANGLSALTALACKARYGTPFVLTEHGIYLRERYLSTGPGTHTHHVRSVLLQFFKLLCAAAYDAADVIAPGSEYNRQWEEVNGAAPGKIHPIYNGVAADAFPIAHQEPDVPTVTWVGRIDPLKDIETLLRAFAKVRASIPDARLRIFGATPEGNEAYAARCALLLDELDLTTAATFEGRVASVVDAYHAGHVVALTSISEGFPYALIEAMATGRPTVSTDVGGVREAAGDAGSVVPPRNPEAVADACIRLLMDGDRREAMGRAARERIRSFFTVEQCMALYSDLYREVTGLPVSAPVVELETTRRYARHATGRHLAKTTIGQPPEARRWSARLPTEAR